MRSAAAVAAVAPASRSLILRAERRAKTNAHKRQVRGISKPGSYLFANTFRSKVQTDLRINTTITGTGTAATGHHQTLRRLPIPPTHQNLGDDKLPTGVSNSRDRECFGS